jgi:hypothetical protein|tara:strand:- start:3042 stop:3281 length:240 start_codon:yes stop_codon:yes gene_type:complete
MNPLAIPKKYYETETKMIHKVGYTIALAMMGIGVLETAHSLPYIIRGESNIVGMTLGPIVIACGGISAFAYLKEAGVDY